MDYDPALWQALLTAYRNAVDSSPPFMLLQNAQGRWARACSDLETYSGREPTGQRTPRQPDLEVSHQRGVDELKQRVAAAEAEMKRIEALAQQAGAQRRELQQCIDGIRDWAKAQSPPITLPGDDAMSMGGFSATSVHVASPPPTARSWP